MGHKYIIVGSGVAGGLITRELLKSGDNDVTLIEAGPAIEMRNYRKWLDLVTTGVTPYDSCLDVGDEYDNHGPHDLVLKNSRLIARGGSTIHWDGCCPRLAPEDFQKKSRTGFGMDWPFGYHDIEHYYESAEHAIGISGDQHRSHVPRAKDFPLPALIPGWMDHQMIEACERLGWKSEQIPMARNVLPINGRAQCQSNGTCRYCPIGGRFTGDQLTEGLETHAHAKLIHGVASKILMRDKRTVVGVEYLDPATRTSSTIEGDRVIICGGAIETTKLLWASTGEFAPHGLGNHSDHLGRHVVAHPLLKLGVGIKTNPKRLRQERYFPTWCTREFDSPKTQSTAKMLIFPFGGPSVDIPSLIADGASSGQVDAAVSGPGGMLIAALVEMREGENNRIELAPGTTSKGLPRTKIFFEWEAESLKTARSYQFTMEKLAHEMGWEPEGFSIDQSTQTRVGVRADHVTGTCRMSKHDADGVVDPQLKVHGLDNLWICSNAVFPSPGVANPTLTLSALALRLAENLS